jgi:hypothetical protein
MSNSNLCSLTTYNHCKGGGSECPFSFATMCVVIQILRGLKEDWWSRFLVRTLSCPFFCTYSERTGGREGQLLWRMQPSRATSFRNQTVVSRNQSLVLFCALKWCAITRLSQPHGWLDQSRRILFDRVLKNGRKTEVDWQRLYFYCPFALYAGIFTDGS